MRERRRSTDLREPDTNHGAARTDVGAHPQQADDAPFDNHEVLARILSLVTRHCGVDFIHFRRGTIERHIERRMTMQRLRRMDDYAALLEGNLSEIDALYHDILIYDTRFFRDEAAFEALKRIVFPAIMQDRPSDLPIRIWVAGCSSGEEVYSIAICLLEFLDQTGVNPPVQIFGSDIDDAAINLARVGIFPGTISGDVSHERLHRFFTQIGTGYEIAKRIRDICIFTKQNLVTDFPFSKLDLISCRNVLCYVGPEFRKRALSFFHYGLRPNGFLLLGMEEGVGGFADLFGLADPESKIHVKKPAVPPSQLEFGSLAPAERSAAQTAPKIQGMQVTGAPDWSKEVDAVLLARYAPPAVVVDQRMQILHARGDTRDFLESEAGQANMDLLKMARGNLTLELRAVVSKAVAERVAVRKERVHFRHHDRQLQINLEVMPIGPQDALSPCFLVVFETLPARQRAERITATEAAAQGRENRLIAELTDELLATKDFLRSAMEQRNALSEKLSVLDSMTENTKHIDTRDDGKPP